ncbi:MAG: bifunctional diaminohydroxyphosphoribosylaminopyrimidine deaminase/5-amino-6-(5-phosphoribosylamino)uracil reductase RibD [Flavobacteriales bacterium]
MTDQTYMNLCIELAKKGLPEAFPNPLVGCVIVHDDIIIGQGYHKQYGQAHAEVNAINSVSDKSLLAQSTLYVSLEPCAHQGKTPPCVDLIIKHQIPKVVIGSLDTYSKVNGLGIQRLKKAGIEVITSVLETNCRLLNKRFFTFHEKKRPFILLKWAKSADGYLAPLNQNKPFWLTGTDSKKLVHQWRSEESAILVGKNTVLKDNPLLTTREVNGHNPIRLVIDKKCSLDKNQFAIFNKEAKTFVINDSLENDTHIKVNFSYFIDSLMSELHKRNIQSVLVEGGAHTLQFFIETNCWDEARVFTSTKSLEQGLQSPVFEYSTTKSKRMNEDMLHYFYNL